MKRFDQQFLARDSESWVGMEVDELVGFLLPNAKRSSRPIGCGKRCPNIQR